MFSSGGSTSIGARAKALCAALVIFSTIAFPALVSHAAIAAPVILKPGANSLQPSHVQVSGTGTSGDKIIVTNEMGSEGRGTVAANGTWTALVVMSAGIHTITAVAEHPTSAEKSLPSNAVTFEVDAGAPTLRITTPATDDYVFGPNDPATVGGTVTDNRAVFAVRVRYYSTVQPMIEELATCDGCGTPSATWTHTPTLLGAGYFTVQVTAIDTANNQTSASRKFANTGTTYTHELPEPPAGVEIGELEIPDPESPLPGETVPGAEKPVVIRGEAEGSGQVEAYETKAGLGSLGYVDSDDQGRWRFRVVLPSGTYAVAFRAIDENGEVSPWSSVLPFTVDATRPSLSILTMDNNVFLPTQPVTLQGRTTDNRGVSLMVVEYWLGSTMVGRRLASCEGCPGKNVSWSDSPKLAQPGYYYAIVRAVDSAGNSSFTEAIHFVKTV